MHTVGASCRNRAHKRSSGGELGALHRHALKEMANAVVSAVLPATADVHKDLHIQAIDPRPIQGECEGVCQTFDGQKPLQSHTPRPDTGAKFSETTTRRPFDRLPRWGANGAGNALRKHQKKQKFRVSMKISDPLCKEYTTIRTWWKE
jgi:hypothetical protein